MAVSVCGAHVPFIPFFTFITHEVPAALCQLPVLFPDVLLNAWNQRLAEWFGLEGALKIIHHGQDCLPLDQVAQSPIQAGLAGSQMGV